MRKKYTVLQDIMTMTHRSLLLSKRNIDTLLTSIAVPAIMMLLFAYIFGGAINVGKGSYVNFIVPAIILQCISQCASSTAISVNNDSRTGIIDRFSTMPIRHSCILTGHVLEAIIRNFIATIVVIIVAFLVGFRPSATGIDWLIAIAILLLYILAMSWFSVFIGMKANSAEGASAFSLLAILLTYVSSGFVPIDTLPEALGVFAKYQPMTPIIDTLRSIMLGEQLDSHTLIIAMLWCIGLMFIFYCLSVRAFKNKNLS